MCATDSRQGAARPGGLCCASVAFLQPEASSSPDRVLVRPPRNLHRYSAGPQVLLRVAGEAEGQDVEAPPAPLVPLPPPLPPSPLRLARLEDENRRMQEEILCLEEAKQVRCSAGCAPGQPDFLLIDRQWQTALKWAAAGKLHLPANRSTFKSTSCSETHQGIVVCWVELPPLLAHTHTHTHRPTSHPKHACTCPSQAEAAEAARLRRRCRELEEALLADHHLICTKLLAPSAWDRARAVLAGRMAASGAVLGRVSRVWSGTHRMCLQPEVHRFCILLFAISCCLPSGQLCGPPARHPGGNHPPPPPHTHTHTVL